MPIVFKQSFDKEEPPKEKVYRKAITPERRKNISESKKGKIWSEEKRQKQSEAVKKARAEKGNKYPVTLTWGRKKVNFNSVYQCYKYLLEFGPISIGTVENIYNGYYGDEPFSPTDEHLKMFEGITIKPRIKK